MAGGPDQGWAWAVASAACAINFITAGMARMYGILFVAFIEEYGADRKEASTPFSVRSSMMNLMGPIVGILGQKYGVRSVTMIGGMIATLSAVACFFAQDMVWITILWGGVGGMGAALTMILPQVTICQYFKKHRTTASGMAFSGGCVSSFLFPVLLEFLLHKYGIQGTFFIIAAILAHTIPAAMILRKPPWLKRSKKLVQISVITTPAPDEKAKSTGYNQVMVQKVCRDFTPLGKEESCPDIGFLKRNNDIIVKMMVSKSDSNAFTEINQNNMTPAMEACILKVIEEMYSNAQFSKEGSQLYDNLTLIEKSSFDEMLEKEGFILDRTHNNRSFRIDKSFQRNSIGKTQSLPHIWRITNEISKHQVMLKLQELLLMDIDRVRSRFPKRSKEDVEKIISELLKLYNANCRLEDDTESIESKHFVENIPFKEVFSNEKEKSNSFFDHIKTALRLYTNPIFMLVCISRAVHLITLVPVVTTVVDFVMDKGLQEHDGKYAIAALSLGDLMGRLCLGWVTDQGYLTLSKYMMVVMVMLGASAASLPLFHTESTLYTTLGVLGMLEGSLFVRHPVLISKYMGSHEQSIAMGCINFFSGFLGFGVPYYIGYFRDTIGDYDFMFYINGAIGVSVGLLWSLEPYFLNRISAKKLREDLMQDPA